MKNRLLIIIFILGVNLVKAQPTATHCEYISQKANAVIEYVQNATKLAKNNQLNDTIIPAVKAKGRFYFR